jgi:cephalosporin hydroxylase
MNKQELIEFIHYSGSQQSVAELEFMYDLIKEFNIKEVLEIGTGVGAFTGMMSAMGCNILTMDIYDSDKFWQFQKRENGVDYPNITYIVGDSQTDEMVAKVGNRKFDLVVIDADHSFEGGLKDWQSYYRYAPIIAIHDINDYKNKSTPDCDWFPTRFWQLIKSCGYFHTREITTNAGGGWGVIFK